MQLRRHCNSKATPTSRQLIWHIISIFWVFLLENIALWEVPRGNHKCRSRDAMPLVNNKLESVQLQRHYISNAEQHCTRCSGFSGSFGLKILFSDVMQSAPGNGHVEPICPLSAMRMRLCADARRTHTVNK